jgi:WXG100 family type VII secretion target
MSAIKVTAEDLSRVSGSLRTGAEDIQGKLSSMESQVNALISADWQGSASSAFNDLYTKWHSGAKQLREALDGISQMLQKSGDAYQQTEDQIASQLRG